MPGKKRAKKGIESLEKQIEIHKGKLRKSQEKGDIGLANYYEKEIKHFEQATERLRRRIAPKAKRNKAL